MKNLSREPSNLLWFFIMSVALHLILLCLLPLTLPPLKAFKDEEGPKFQLVDFITIDANEGRIQPPSIPDVNEGPTLAKEETNAQIEKNPQVNNPIMEPKPANKNEGVKGPKVDTTKSEPDLINKDAKTAAKPESKVEKTANPEQIKTDPAKPTPNPDNSKVVASENSNKLLELPTENGNRTAKNPEQSKGTLPSTPTETGESAPGQQQEELKPSLPTSPADTLAKFVKPVYPKNAANENVEGIVHLQVKVDTAGNIEDMKITNPSGDKRLDDVAFNTIKLGWKFKSFSNPYILTLKVVFKASEVNITYGELKFSQ